MVCHVRLDDPRFRKMSGSCSTEVESLVEAQLPAPSQFLDPPRVLDSCGSVERQGEEGCVTGDHQSLSLVPFQSHQGYAECLVLVPSMLVEMVVTGFGDSPGDVVLTSEGALLLHCTAA